MQQEEMEATDSNNDTNNNTMMDDAPMQEVDNHNNADSSDEEIDDTPLFVGEGDAVEVQVDDTHVPMEDDDDDDNGGDDATGMQQQEEPIVDMARFVISSHSDPVYAVACAVNTTTTTSSGTTTSVLRVVSGGGDDKAYWHEIPLSGGSTSTSSAVQSTSLEPHYQFKDSVSAIAGNAPFIGFDATKPPNPEWMAVGGLDGSVVLFGPGNGKVQPLEGPTSDIEWLCWHPKGGNVLLIGSSDATIWMYHTTMNKCLQVFVGHEDAVTCGAFSADGKVALSGSADGTLRIWAPKTGKSKHVFRFTNNANVSNGGGGGGPPSALTCMATHGGTDQQLVMAGVEDGQAHICHVANKKHVVSLRHYDTSKKNTNITQEDGVMLPSSVEAVGFSKSTPNWCATGGMDGVLKIWDLANQAQCRHSCHVNQTTATAPEQQQQQQQQSTTPSGDGITQLTWHPTLPLVITCTCRGQVHLWDARNGQLLQSLTGHADVINDMDVSFVPPSNGGVGGHAVVVTASDDKSVRIFDLDIDAVLLQASQQ